MHKIWLPISYTIREPTTGREQILFIPGAERMPISQLREIIAWQEQKTLAELKARGPKPEPRYSKENVAGAIKDYLAWRKKKEGR